MTIPEIVADVVTRLERAEIPFAIGGSLASSSWGQVRYTNDADIAILLDNASVPRLGAAFQDHYYLNLVEAAECSRSADEFRAVQLVHTEEAFKIDLFLLHGTPYELGMLERARRVDSPSLFGTVCAPEDIVLFKLRWFVLGNRVSDRQWHDIVQVLEIQLGHLDEEYLDKWSEHFGVHNLLTDARFQTRK